MVDILRGSEGITVQGELITAKSPYIKPIRRVIFNRIIEITTNGEELNVFSKPVLASGDVETAKIKVTFDDAWIDFTKSAVFFTDLDKTAYEVVLASDNTAVIPKEVLTKDTGLLIGIRGVNGAKVITSSLIRYKIVKGAPEGTGTAVTPTPDVYQQVLTQLGDLKAKVDNLSTLKEGSTTADAELIDIRLGYDGVTYNNAGTAVRTQFTNIDNDVNSLVIKCDTEENELLNIRDSADFQLQELHIYGKSTQDGTPTLENPVDIVSVVNPTVESRNVSLFDFNSLPKNTCIKCFFKKGTRFGIVFKDGYASLGGNLKFYDKDKVVMWCGLDKGITKTTYTLSNDCYMLMNESDNTNFMLYVYNGVYLSYEPYRGLSQQFNYTLNGINDVKDELIAYKNGKGKLVKNYKLFTTSDLIKLDWVINVGWSPDNTISAYCMTLNPNAEIDSNGYLNGKYSLCNCLALTKGAVNVPNKYGISINSRTGKILLYISLDSKGKEKTNPSFIELLKELDIKMLVAVEQTVTDISVEQVAQLKTYYPVTNIFTDTNATLKAKYVADTKAYIDNQINNLTAMVLEKES